MSPARFAARRTPRTRGRTGHCPPPSPYHRARCARSYREAFGRIGRCIARNVFFELDVGWLVYSCGRRAAIMREHALVRLNLCLLVTCCVANWDAVTGGRSFSPSAPSSGAPANSELAQALEYPPPGFLQGPKPECILHVGPHKTGTSSLQALLFQRASMLQSDGWHQPPNLPGTTLDNGEYAHIPGFKGGVNLALFLQTRTPNTSEPIWLAFASWVQAKARRRENIVLSSEEFDRTSAHISLLARVLTVCRSLE